MDNLSLVRATAFRDLHRRDGIFAIPNPWDAGSAKLLASLGFEAIATTSAGLAFSLGKPDGQLAITRTEAIANAKSIVDAVAIPVSADLENGYGHEPEDCAETIKQAAAAGLAGCSIEDTTGNAADPIYPFQLAVTRIEAAVKATRLLPLPFQLTARAENLIYGRPDLTDTINRLEAFAAAGADVLFAPGLKTKQDIVAVVKAVAPKPVSVLMGIANADFSLRQLEDMGVKRVSIGSSLARAAYHYAFEAAKEIRQKGTFDYAKSLISYAELNKLFS